MVKQPCSDDQGALEKMFTYHPATGEQPGYYGAVRGSCLTLAKFLCSALPESWERDEAIKKLNEVMFWANASIARHMNGKSVPQIDSIGKGTPSV